MNRIVKKRVPTYLEEFKCVGGKCEDSCCIGWDIDIDKSTFKQYFKVEDKEMKRMFQKNVHNNNNCRCHEVDYGKVKLKKDKRCPFLDNDNYCIIYTKIGEEYLSNVCTSFPRITNKVDGVYEMSLDVACPEAARILLLKENGIIFKECEGAIGKHIVAIDVNTFSKEFNNSPIKYFKEIRELSIEIIKNRKFSLSERLYILGDFINKLEDEIQYNYKNLHTFIEEYDINNINNFYERSNMNYIIQVDFFQKMLGFLDVFNEVDSDSFKEYTSEIIKGYNFKEGQAISDNYELYIKAFENYIKDTMNENEYIFENYLVNFMYSNMFPFGETESIFDEYIMLLARYSFIRFYLVGIYLNNKKHNKESIVEFIQSFSKAVEHHRDYLEKSLNYIKENEFDNIEFAKTLI